MAVVERKKSYGYHDVVAIIDGQKVCWGDMKFVAQSLGLSYGSLRSYMSSNPVPGLVLERLPELWDIDGALFTTEEAQAQLGLENSCKKSLTHNPAVTRMRWCNCSLPAETIDELRRRSKVRRKHARRLQRMS